MTALGNFKIVSVRSNFLFGLGAHLAVNGFLLLAIYYLVVQISVQDARELLIWLVPAAQGCCVLAAILLAGGLALRDASEPGGEAGSPRGWMIGKIMPFGARKRSATAVRAVEAKPAAADVERALTVIKGLDWSVFKALGNAYFRELGFRVVDEPERSSGVDFLLYTEDDYSPVAVRCLPWGTERVDIKQVRHVHRAMLLAGASQGVMLTTGVFDEEALEFGEDKALELLGGESFVSRFLSLPPETWQRLLREAAGAESVRGGQKTGELEGLLAKAR